MLGIVDKKINLTRLEDINSAMDLLKLVYGDTQDIELPINVDLIIKKIDNVKLIQELDFKHLDKAGFIKVNRNSCNDVNDIDIWVNPLEPDVRQRFTKAHEIGHLIYDISPELNNPELDDELIDVLHRKEGQKSFRETRANRFAAQLLMPAFLVQKETLKLVQQIKLTKQKITKEEVISRLSGIFYTSNDAMKYRLKDLHII